MNQIRVKFILFFICFLALSNLGISQNMDHPGPPKPPSPEQMEKMVNELAKALSLSTEQKEAILKIQLDHMKAMKEKMDKQAKQGPPDQATMEAARKELDQKIMALLTAEQKVKYTKFMESHKPPKRGGAGGPGGPGGPPQH
jgi:Spy/CpxP family protein refolding chaperone